MELKGQEGIILFEMVCAPKTRGTLKILRSLKQSALPPRSTLPPSSLKYSRLCCYAVVQLTTLRVVLVKQLLVHDASIARFSYVSRFPRVSTFFPEGESI